MVPDRLQRALWHVYVKGQEDTKQVSRAYCLVQTRCRLSIAQAEGLSIVATRLCIELRALLAPLTFQGRPLLPGIANYQDYSNSDMVVAADDVIERILSGELVRRAAAPSTRSPLCGQPLPDASAKPHQPSPFPCVVLDTETTGIFGRHPWAEVVELGAVALDEDGVECAHFERYVQPTDIDDPRMDEALAINHIDRGVLYGAPDPIDVLYEFLAWLPLDQAGACTAYNVAFDKQGLEKMGALALTWGPCVLLRARRELPKPHKLGDVAERLGITVRGDAHRALTDSRTAADVLVALERRSRG